jgi:hypothetical protein
MRSSTQFNAMLNQMYRRRAVLRVETGGEEARLPDLPEV